MAAARLPAAVLAAGLLAGGCEHAELFAPETPAAPSLAAVQERIFSPSCARSGCHAGGGAAFGLDLSEGLSYGSIVGVRSREVPLLYLVRPGEPDASYLVMKVRGDSGIVGMPMPMGGAPIADADLTLLEEWIAAGAPID
jgi:hypothetical protein